jgi:hypothetical protein
MKSIQFTVIIFLLVLISHAQNPHNGVYFGLPNKNVSIRDLVEYYDQGYYLQTSASSSSGAESMSWNIKTDINKYMLWNQFLTHNAGITRGNAVVLDNEGNRYVGGSFNFNSSPDLPFVTKFSSCGEKEWCVMLPKEGYMQGLVSDILINENEEIIVLMIYLAPSNQATSDFIFLAALSKEGEFLWREVYASPSSFPLLRYPTAFYMTYHNGEYFLSGYCYYAYPNNPNHFYLTPFFVGIDSQFQEKWILPFGMEDSIRGRAYEIIPFNDDMLMGMVDHWLPGTEKRTTLAFFDTEGNVTGYKAITNESLNPEYTWNVTTTAQAIEESVFVSPIYFGPPSQEFWGEIIYDTSGNIYNFNVTGQHDQRYEMAKTSDENFIVGVTVKNNSIYRSIYLYKFDENLQSVPFDTTTYVYDSLCPYPIQSGTIDLTGCMVLTSTDWIPTPQEYYARIRTIPITIYPNPAKDRITFALENTEHHRNIELRCFNLLGMLQYQTRVAPNPNGVKNPVGVETNVGNWPPGMYIAVVYSDGKPVGRGKFVVQR